MYFEDIVDLYLNDIKSRIKYKTWLTKKHIVEKKILPYFSKKKLQEIKPSDIRQDSPIFFEKEVAGNKTFRYSTVAEHHDELSK